jgi:carbon storage regulator
MLVLTRRLGEEIVIAGLIRVRVIAAGNGKVRLGITAPEQVPIYREEIQQTLQKSFPFAEDSTPEASGA